MLTIAAVVSVQDLFVIPDGGNAGALAELERRKFTAEEGVSRPSSSDVLLSCLTGGASWFIVPN